MIYDNILWSRFAAAALASGDLAGTAASRADLMLKEYKKRWCNNPLAENNDDDTNFHRASSDQ